MSSRPSDSTLTTPPAPLAPTKPTQRAPLFTAGAWAPLKVELFRSLWIATSIAQIGTWAREAAGPWLMKVLTDGAPNQPAMVGRVLVFSNLPICLFSVFAGALADVLDRRRLLIVTQVWMMVVSAALGLLTLFGLVSPWGLLGLTFLLGVGTAAFGPALQAVLPELVPKKDFALAINMNSVALNVARAVGPALFILVVSIPRLQGLAGVGTTFLLTALSFVAAVVVLWRWDRPPQRAAVHGEEMWDAIRAGWRYTVHSPANRAILLRVLTFIVPAVVLWSQVPIIAVNQLNRDAAVRDIRHQQETGAITARQAAALLGQRQERVSALLFAFVGIGAVLGVALMPGLHGRYRIDPVVNVCIALFAAGLVALSFVHVLWLAAPVLLFLGVNWVIIPTNFNTATQKSVPPWVKGRAISFYLTVLFGSFALGGAIWGPLTQRTSISTSLLLGGLSMAAMLLLAHWFPLTLNEGLDLSPVRWGEGAAAETLLPDLPGAPDPAAGPNLMPSLGGNGSPAAATAAAATAAATVPDGPLDVTVEYDVDPAGVDEFLALMPRIGQLRRRNGATHWRLRADSTSPAGEFVRYLERFRFDSAAEYARQSARMTVADADLLGTAHAHLRSADGGAPAVRTAVGPADLSESPGLRHATRAWAAARLAECLDRALAEAEAAVDRFVALAERDRQARRG